MGVIVEIKKEDSKEEVEKKLRDLSVAMGKIKDHQQEIIEEKKERLRKFFGVLKLNEDPVTLQRRWRDEW